VGYFHDLASRASKKVQITTDGHRAYLEAVEDAFGAEVDYAPLQKIYGAPQENEKRYSPAVCIGCDMKVVSGDPDPKHVSTSYVERQHWTVRTMMRRYTRLSNGFSHKLRNHAAATALTISPTTSPHFIVHFARVRQWPLALQISFGALRTWLPFGKLTSSGGRKEQRNAR
jgi:hypothetical protein